MTFRETLRSTITHNWLALALVAIALVWRLFLFLGIPENNGDSAWYLSQTYSLLRGEWLTSTFGHSAFQPYLLPYMYALITAPFFGIFGQFAISLFLWNVVLLIGIVLCVLLLCTHFQVRSPLLRALLAFTFVTWLYYYGPRPEITIVLMQCAALLVAVSMQTPRTRQIVLLAVIVAVTGLTQPVGGLFSLLLLIGIGIQRRFPLRYAVLLVVCSGAIALLLYAPIILVDPAEWVQQFFVSQLENDERGVINLSLIVKTIALNPFMYVPFGLMLIYLPIRRAALELIVLIALFALILPFSRSYYYVYIALYIVWRVVENAGALRPSWLTNAVWTTLLIVMPFFSHYIPTFQQFENPEYAARSRAIAAQIVSIVEANPDDVFWVESRYAMHVIGYPNARMYYMFYRRITDEPIPLDESTRILLTEEGAFDILAYNLDSSMSALSIENLIAPSEKGLIRLEPFFIQRGRPIGLWEISLPDA